MKTKAVCLGAALALTVFAWLLTSLAPAGAAQDGNRVIITGAGPAHDKELSIERPQANPILALIREEMRTIKPGDKLSSARIGEMANRFGLTDPEQFNFRLAMNQGDFSFYAGQNWPAWRIIVELAAKRLVLEAANRDRVTIPSKGDWSAYAEQVMDLLPVENIRKGQP